MARTGSGCRTFNACEWGGNAAAVALSNAWYPDTRTATENVEKLLFQCGTDAVSNVLKRFWPDVKGYFQHRVRPNASANSSRYRHPTAVEGRFSETAAASGRIY